MEIASYNCSIKGEAKYANYFVQKEGYSSDIKNLEMYSHNFVTIAVQLIMAGVAIKPKKLFENE